MLQNKCLCHFIAEVVGAPHVVKQAESCLRPRTCDSSLESTRVHLRTKDTPRAPGKRERPFPARSRFNPRQRARLHAMHRSAPTLNPAPWSSSLISAAAAACTAPPPPLGCPAGELLFDEKPPLPAGPVAPDPLARVALELKGDAMSASSPRSSVAA